MASSLVNEIMGDLRKGKGGGSSKAGAPVEDDAEPVEEMETEGEEYGSDEEKAMADFTDATTPAEKAAAMRAFLEICVPKIMGGSTEE